MSTKAHRTFLANFKKYLSIDGGFENFEKILELENYFRENLIELATKQNKDQILELFKSIKSKRKLQRKLGHFRISRDYKENSLDDFILAYLIIANDIKLSNKDVKSLIRIFFTMSESFYSEKNWQIIESKLKKYLINKKNIYLDYPDYNLTKIAIWKSIIDIGCQNGVNVHVSFNNVKNKKFDIEYCAPLYGAKRVDGEVSRKMLSYCLEKNYKIALNSQVNYMNVDKVKLPRDIKIGDKMKFTELSLNHKMGSFRLELLKYSWYSNHVLNLITNKNLRILEKWWCNDGHENIRYASLSKSNKAINNFINCFLDHIKIMGIQSLTIAKQNVPYLIFYNFFAKAKASGVKKITFVNSTMFDGSICIDNLENKSLKDLKSELNSFPEVRKLMEDLLANHHYYIKSYSSYQEQSFKFIKLIKDFRLRLHLIFPLLRDSYNKYNDDEFKLLERFLSEERLLPKIKRDLEFFKKFPINSRKILFSFLLKCEKNVFKKAVINDLKQKALV